MQNVLDRARLPVEEHPEIKVQVGELTTVCVHACVCVRERAYAYVCVHACLCMCACMPNAHAMTMHAMPSMHVCALCCG